MSKDLYTATQKKFLNAKEINELQVIMGDQIILEILGIMNQLKIYKLLKNPGFFGSRFARVLGAAFFADYLSGR